MFTYGHREPGKVAAAMWKDYLEKSGDVDPKLNKPLRHYPAHHYRRDMRQKVGLQRKASKLQSILRTATTPNPRDDCANLDPKLHTRILDAFKLFEGWLEVSNTRLRRPDKQVSESLVKGSYIFAIGPCMFVYL
ncbi:uncharacterized protein BXIN_0851 [Babesia sp. Xinjiang]|uniref:uncharacterized protein n=1 Tax=Babesia sp. Xinjiang TaxID=462227 RepID=UPI000A2195CD|nr:uncharacterized protein BXIN_0851 [Babesia sp. Xinjiang]ORM41269.1 hypothetical protein BXIN_0851 [Babesia sp. Xinjiang]